LIVAIKKSHKKFDKTQKVNYNYDTIFIIYKKKWKD